MSARIVWLFLIFNTVVHTKNVRIVGGRVVNITEFPYAASFRWISNNKHFCGGAIVSERYIVTAAHCVNDLHNRKHEVTIHVGATSISSTSSTVLTIRKILVDPEYTGKMDSNEKNRHDFAMVKVKETIIFNVFQNKVNIPTEDIRGGDNAVLCGWGVTSYPVYSLPEELRKASMKVVQNEECTLNVGFPVYFEQMCAFNRQGVGACVGDSGTPLVKNGILIGIGSFIQPCAIGYPDIYTRVYSYRKFINSIIGT